MFQKLNKLSFIIAIFFLMVSLILIIASFNQAKQAATINQYTGIVFFLFGAVMLIVEKKDD